MKHQPASIPYKEAGKVQTFVEITESDLYIKINSSEVFLERCSCETLYTSLRDALESGLLSVASLLNDNKEELEQHADCDNINECLGSNI